MAPNGKDEDDVAESLVDIEVIEVFDELPPSPRPKTTRPPPLPPEVTGEHDPLKAPRTTLKSKPVTGAAGLPPLPPAAGWFSSVSPTRPTWESPTPPVVGQTSDASADPTPPRPSDRGQTVRLMVPLPAEPQAEAPVDSAALSELEERSDTLRMRTPFAEEAPEVVAPTDAPAPRRGAPSSTTVLRVPLATDPEPPEIVTSPPRRSDATARITVPLPADPDPIESRVPTPGRLATEPQQSRTGSAEPVEATMVIPVGRPAVIPTTGELPSAPPAEPQPEPAVGGARAVSAAPGMARRPPTGELEAAAQLGAAGALGRPAPTSEPDAMPFPPARAASDRRGAGPMVAALLVGLLLGTAAGFFAGRELFPGSVPVTIVAEPGSPPGPEPAGTAKTEPEADSELASAEPEVSDEAAPGDPTQGAEGSTGPVAATAGTEPEEAGGVAEAAPVEPSLRPVVFAEGLWEPGNTWVFRYRRSESEPGSTSTALDYFFRRRVEAVSPHPFGRLVTVVDEGGITQPASRQLLATASCLLEPDTLRAVLCLPREPADLATIEVAGVALSLTERIDETDYLAVSPEVGWVHESHIDRQGRKHESALVGFRVADRVVGDVERPILTCDWVADLDRGERAGRVGRDDSAEMAAAGSWGLRGSVRRFDAPLGGSHGFSWLRAWHDEARTAYQLIPSSPDPEAPVVDLDAPTEIVELPLSEVKVWTAPDGLTEHVALVFDDGDDRNLVRLVTISADGPIQNDLLPESHDDGGRLSVVLLANPNACYVQIRRGRWQQMQHSDFELTAAGPRALAAEVPAPAPAPAE